MIIRKNVNSITYLPHVTPKSQQGLLLKVLYRPVYHVITSKGISPILIRYRSMSKNRNPLRVENTGTVKINAHGRDQRMTLHGSNCFSFPGRRSSPSPAVEKSAIVCGRAGSGSQTRRGLAQLNTRRGAGGRAWWSVRPTALLEGLVPRVSDSQWPRRPTELARRAAGQFRGLRGSCLAGRES